MPSQVCPLNSPSMIVMSMAFGSAVGSIVLVPRSNLSPRSRVYRSSTIMSLSRLASPSSAVFPSRKLSVATQSPQCLAVGLDGLSPGLLGGAVALPDHQDLVGPGPGGEFLGTTVLGPYARHIAYLSPSSL